MMKMKKHFSILLNAALSAVLAIGLSACSEDIDLTNNDPNNDKPINFDDYPTRFGTGDVVAAAKEMLSGPFKTSTNYNMQWFWTYPDKIWVDTARIVNGAKAGESNFIQEDVNDIPKTGEEVPWANFYMGAVLKGNQYEVRYTGNDLDNTAGTGNGKKYDEVTIAAHQIQSAPGNSLHMGKYGDCGVDTSARRESQNVGYHKFLINHKAAYVLFTPKVKAEQTEFALTNHSFPLKSITVTKTDADGQICGTYPFHPVDGVVKLDVPNVDNPGKTIKLEIENPSSLGTSKKEDEAYYMVVQPGQHNFDIIYELDNVPVLKLTYDNNGKITGVEEEESGKAKISRSISKTGGYKFSENGFTKISHTLTIPAYREQYTYYTWGASANYHSKDIRETDSKSYSFNSPKTAFISSGEKIEISYPKAGDFSVTSCGPLVNNKDSILMGYNRQAFLIGEYVESYGSFQTLKKPFRLQGDLVDYINLYAVPAHMPLWNGKPNDTENGFYSYELKTDTCTFKDKVMEPPFLTETNRDVFLVYASKTQETMTYKKDKNGNTRNINIDAFVATTHVLDRQFEELYRSIRRMPSANEMTWYMEHGDIYYDENALWIAADKTIGGTGANKDKNPLVRGGIWIKKKQYISGFTGENTADGKNCRESALTYTKTIKKGRPDNTDQYFFLPLLGYYHTDASISDRENLNVSLRYYGKRGYYWTRTQHPSDDRKAYYLLITEDNVTLTTDMDENKKHGMVGNERPDWQRYMPEATRKVTTNNNVIQNDWWFQ